ncbi:MAG: tyrosine-type recombinase/integrase [Blastocatellia bacterium]
MSISIAEIREALCRLVEVRPHSRDARRNILRRHFKPILKEAKLSTALNLYSPRHSCATLLLTAGVNPKIVSERLGHASIVLTLDTYSHVLPSMQQAAVDKLETLPFAKG